jgi:hypothetical protein
MKVKRFLAILAALSLAAFLAAPAMADLVYLDTTDPTQMTSTRSAKNPGEIFATAGWDGYFTVSWAITDNGDGTFSYSYTISGFSASGVSAPLDPDISHFILSLTNDGFGLLDGGTLTTTPDTTVEGPMNFEPGGSNPSMPDDLYGLKFELDPASGTLEISFTTTRAPVWGDFYAVDGKTPGAEVYAYNVGFGTMPSGDFAGWIAVPNSAVVPLPGTALLLGGGLLGLAVLGLRRRRS